MSDTVWVETQLKRLCSRGPEYGANIPSDQYENTGLRFLRTTDISDAGLLRAEDTAVYVSRAQATSAGALLQSGDLLLSRSGSIGRSFLYDERLHGPCSFAGYLVRFRPTADIEPRFLFHWTKSLGFEQQLNADAIQTTIQNFNGQKYASMSLRIPRAKEHQRAIADFLDRKTAVLDALIDKKERVLSLASELVASTVESFFGAKGIRESSHARLSYLAEITPGYAFSSDDFSDNPSDVRLLRGINVVPGGTRWSDSVYCSAADASRFLRWSLREGDLVIGMDRPWISSGLRIAEISRDDLPCLLLQRVARIRSRGRVRTRFIAAALRTAAFKTHIEPEMTGVGVPHISGGQIGSFRLPVVPMAVQDEFLEMLRARERAVGKLARILSDQLDRLREYRQALITAAVTGQLDVTSESAP